MKSASNIAFIGGGNMVRSLVGGLVGQGHDPATIRVAEPAGALREALARDFGVRVDTDNARATEAADMVVLAVKPQVMPEVCRGLRGLAMLDPNPLVVSIAAGIASRQIEGWLGGGMPIVRCMPNTAVLVGAGATGLFANERVSGAQRLATQELLSATGLAVWVDDEGLMDAVTALSGSGPAYVFLLAEAMIAAGEAEGLPGGAAHALALQTVLGAARMLVESGETPGELRRRVTSPDGTTQAALESFERDGFRDLVARAIHAARTRGHQLSATDD